MLFADLTALCRALMKAFRAHCETESLNQVSFIQNEVIALQIRIILSFLG